MKFIDLFSGIGGFRLAMERAGHECVGYCEIDKFARKSYQAIFNTEGEWTEHDIRNATDESIRGIGRVDVICGGFPCQAFSVAGKRQGFADTRGTLFFEIMRFASILRPRYLFCENVPGLLNHEGGDTFETILRAMDEVGYDAEWDCLNSKDFGVPQNRERVFLIGHLRGASTRKVFPFGTNKQTADGIQGLSRTTNTLTARYGDAAGNGSFIAESERTAQRINGVGNLDIKGDDYIKRVYGTDGISPALPTMQGGKQEPKIAVPVLTPDRPEKRQNGRRFKENGEPMFTLTGQDRHGVMDGNHHIRKLTPRECWRLQGFPDWAFDRAQKVNSDSQLYKQAGNSVTVNVIYEIAKRL
ncbi:DNA cytosine methyltransferase [Sporolactobacillus sp. THM7-7]|nr:DNA cytosine methyltransferase [Sporolactobacillus sp. THM7-7]